MEALCIGILGVLLPAVGWIMYKLGGVEKKVETLCELAKQIITRGEGSCD